MQGGAARRATDLSQPGGHFDFLGYRFDAKTDGRTGRTIKPKKQKALRARMAELTSRTCGSSTQDLVRRLNIWLRGVFEYFRHAEQRVLANLDAHVRYRLRRIIAKRRGIAGGAKRWKVHSLWPNTYFTALGPFSLAAARADVLHSHRGLT